MKRLLITLVNCVIALSLAHGAPAIQQQADTIDAALTSQYAAAHVTANAIINDDQFVRRAYLQITGRIPTYTEYQAFVNAVAPNKRTELVRYLVNTPGYVSNLYNFWADQLRVRERLNNTNFFNGVLYIDWIKQQIANNVPYDQFVKQLLLSKGDYYNNPATGYYERDLAMPLDNVIASCKVFLGINVTCAQCHDDPFQDWSQKQFYEFASYFYTTTPTGRKTANPAGRDKIKEIRAEVEALIKADPTKRGLNNQVNNFLSATMATVIVDENKKLALPPDYRYSDVKPGTVVDRKVLFGNSTAHVTDGDPRQPAVDWMTSKNHPTFTKNIVNRYWAMLMGRPIAPRVDDIYSDAVATPANPLLLVLEQVMKDVNYNTRDFIQIVCSTKAFQRASYQFEPNDRFVFIGPVMTRLTAEQIWDSILSFTVDKPEYFSSTFGQQYKQVMSVNDYDAITLGDVQAKLATEREVSSKKYYGAINYKGSLLIRASEINDQTGSNNIISQLGRSDRELIGTSSRDGSVTQVISLVNGALSDIATKQDGSLMTALKGKSPAERVEMVFKSIINRKPTLLEKSIFAKASDADLVWALINTNEFRFGS